MWLRNVREGIRVEKWGTLSLFITNIVHEGFIPRLNSSSWAEKTGFHPRLFGMNKTREEGCELWAWKMERHPILSSMLEREMRAQKRTGEWKRSSSRTERQMDRNMIYPDLGSSLRAMKGGTRERWQWSWGRERGSVCWQQKRTKRWGGGD